MRRLAPLFASLALLAAGVVGVVAQDPVPTTQPGLLTIHIEEIKLGMESAHANHERGWPEAFAKANTPETYLALVSVTGPSEVWFVVPFESYAKESEAMQRYESDPALSAQLDRLWRDHGQYVESARVVQTVARPDLSYGAFPDIARARFWDITTFRVRPGQDAAFEAAARKYGEVAGRLAPDMSYRVYMVTAGMPSGTYFVFSSVNDYAQFDQMMATSNSVWEGMTDDEREVFDTFAREAAQVTITNRFRLDPQMSYVDDATKAVDPAFWNQN